LNPFVYEFSDIDMSDYAQLRGPEADYFVLFEFSAKEDPVPTMLTQCHVNMVNGFLGQTTSFNRATLKPSTLVLADVPNTPEVRYVHGNFGKGTFTFLAGTIRRTTSTGWGTRPLGSSCTRTRPATD